VLLTESPDNRFVIDTLPGEVVACGDGRGFKFSVDGPRAGRPGRGPAPDADIATFGLARFAAGFPDRPHVLGR
jgi:hypothetical protein